MPLGSQASKSSSFSICYTLSATIAIRGRVSSPFFLFAFVSLKLQSVFFFVLLCELGSLVGVVRQEDEGEPDYTGGISNQGDDTR
jgi:hypothetical protein